MLKSAISFAVAVTCLLIAVAAAERAFSPFFQSCIAGQDSVRAARAKDNKSPELVSDFDRYVQCSGQFADRHGVGITALATIVIAAFTGTLWMAAIKDGELNRESMITDKRAFIQAVGLGQFWEEPSPGVYCWRFRPQWRNHGATPTKNMQMYSECELRTSPLPTGYAFPYKDADIRTGYMPPRGEFYGGIVPLGAAIRPRDIAEIQRRTKLLYMWGWMKYNDVFPRTQRHITHFC